MKRADDLPAVDELVAFMWKHENHAATVRFDCSTCGAYVQATVGSKVVDGRSSGNRVARWAKKAAVITFDIVLAAILFGLFVMEAVTAEPSEPLLWLLVVTATAAIGLAIAEAEGGGDDA